MGCGPIEVQLAASKVAARDRRSYVRRRKRSACALRMVRWMFWMIGDRFHPGAGGNLAERVLALAIKPLFAGSLLVVHILLPLLSKRHLLS